jgi:hypothetical protein
MSPAEFVIAAAQLGAGVGRASAFPRLDSTEDWPAVEKLAAEHRVAPLIAEALSRHPEVEVPSSSRQAFAAELLRSRATRLLCETTLASTVSLLRARGVEVIVLKGATVAHQAYPRPELRMYHDLDLLCRTADYPALLGALSEHGYTDAGTADVHGTHERLASKPSAWESQAVRGFYDPTGDMKLEIHFDTLQLGLLDRRAELYWQNARRLQVAGVEINTLRPEHQLLHLTTHAHRHCYSRLSWLIEIDLLIRQGFESVDWTDLAELARAEGVGAMLRHGIATCHAVLETPLPALPPPNIEERCLTPLYRQLWPFEKVRRLDQWEHKRLLHFLPDEPDPRFYLYGLLVVGRRRDKLRALFRRDIGLRWARHLSTRLGRREK